MKASEARQKADRVKELIIHTEYNRIMSQIIRQAENGEYSVTVDKISNEIKNRLETEGYKVTYFGDQRDGVSEYSINWSK